MNQPDLPIPPASDPVPDPHAAEGLTAANSVQVGTQFFNQRYQILGRLGKGGLGEVLLAHDRDTGRQVALKIMRGDRQDARRRRRFFAEAIISAQLQHPGIVPVYTIHSEEHFYTMRPISGHSLGRILRLLRKKDKAATDAYPLSRLVDTVIAVAQAVGYAHHRGVVHGDLKPHNIMIGDYGEVLTLDWGLSRLPKHLPPDAVASAPLRIETLVQATLHQSSDEPPTRDSLPAGEPVNEADTVDVFERQDTADSGRLPSGAHPGLSSTSTRTFVRAATPDPQTGTAGIANPGSDLPDLPEPALGRANALPSRASGSHTSLHTSSPARVDSVGVRVTLPDAMQPDKNEPIAGTPAYMAPEVISGHLPDYASDVFSLGVTLYECLTLQKLHAGKDMNEIIAAVKAGQYVAPHKAAPDRRIPLELSRICMMALDAKSKNRHASALALAQQLKKFREDRTNWHLIYRENFVDRPKPASWEQVQGKWVWDGEGLRLDTTDGLQGVLHFRQACPRDLRIEIEGLVLPDHDGELALMLSCKPPAAGHRATNGYCFQFGANMNLRSKIAKDDVDLAMDPTVRLTPGMVHTVVAERRGDLLRLIVDDETAIEYRDLVPLNGPRIGFYNYGDGARIQRISIYGGGISEMVSCLSIPDDYFNNKKFDEALRRYLTIADAMSDTETGLIARLKAGLCQMELGNLTAAVGHFEKLADTFYQGYRSYGLALVAAREKNAAAELAALKNALDSRTPEARETARLLVWERISHLIERGLKPDHVLNLFLMARDRLRKRDTWQFAHHGNTVVGHMLRDFRYTEAEGLINDILAQDHNPGEFQDSMLNYRVTLAMNTCQFDKVLQLTSDIESHALQNLSTSRSLVTHRVRAFIHKREYEAAQDLLETALGRGNLTPASQALFMMQKADLLLQTLRPESAWQVLDQAASNFQNVTGIFAQVLIAQASTALRLGRYHAVLALLKKFPASVVGSHHVEDNNNVLAGVAWTMLNQPRQALQQYRQVLLRQDATAFEVIQSAFVRSAIAARPTDAQQAAKFLEQAEARGDVGITARVCAFCQGRATMQEARARTAPIMHDMLSYYAGEWELAQGDADAAAVLFRNAITESPLVLGWTVGQARTRLQQLGQPVEPLALKEPIPEAIEALEKLAQAKTGGAQD